MEIIREVRLELTDEELKALKEAGNILHSICLKCSCNPQDCPLYGLCSAGDTPSIIGQVLNDIINEATTE